MNKYKIIKEIGCQYVIYNGEKIFINSNFHDDSYNSIAIELSRGGKIILAIR